MYLTHRIAECWGPHNTSGREQFRSQVLGLVYVLYMYFFSPYFCPPLFFSLFFFFVVCVVYVVCVNVCVLLLLLFFIFFCNPDLSNLSLFSFFSLIFVPPFFFNNLTLPRRLTKIW